MLHKNSLPFTFILVLVCFCVYHFFVVHKSKIAFVRTAEVVNKYYGMKEAKDAYRKKIEVWQSNVDTLELDYQKALNNFRINQDKLSAAEKIEKETYLKKQEETLRQYIANLEEKAKEEDQKMTDGVINQVNQHIETFGKENDYDLIVGTNVSGTVLYGSSAIDVTNLLIEHLNNKYLNK